MKRITFLIIIFLCSTFAFSKGLSSSMIEKFLQSGSYIKIIDETDKDTNNGYNNFYDEYIPKTSVLSIQCFESRKCLYIFTDYEKFYYSESTNKYQNWRAFLDKECEFSLDKNNNLIIKSS